MNNTARTEADGYAVEVSLLKLNPRALVLAALCSATLAATLVWVGGGGGEIAVSQTVANHAANTERRGQTTAIPNNATSQPARVDEKKAASTPSQPLAETAAVPGPSPAGFAENNAPNAAPAASEVAPNSVAAPAPTATTTTPSGAGYAVQVGSFNTVSEANERVSALRAAGFEARTAAVEIAGRGTWHRVYAGRFPTREEAAAHDKKLRASGAVAATIITPVQD